jgi:gas vesicle protein
MAGDDRGLSSGAVLLAFLTGAAAGAVAALLYAPKSGRESREQLRGYARQTEEGIRELAGRAGELWDETVEKGKDFLEDKKTVLSEALEAGREAIRRERDRRGDETPG